MKTAINIALSTLSGLILSASWPLIGNQTYLIFIALIPLLLMESRLSSSNKKWSALSVFLISYPGFLIFNYVTTWWIKLASPGGMVLAVVFNTLFMSLVFTCFHITKKWLGRGTGYWALIIYWIAFEYLHINWELSWVWLNLGNVFANDVTWIQWYEYTGVLGGSAWILLTNVFLFNVIAAIKEKRLVGIRRILWPLSYLSLLIIPLIVSNQLYTHYKEVEDPVEVLLLQPNIDPYNDKFSGMSEAAQIDKLMLLAQENITLKTELVFGPETAFPMSYWEHDLENVDGVKKVRNLIDKFPNATFIVGLTSIRRYLNGEARSETARPFSDGSGNYYDYYNTAMQIEFNCEPHLYRKSQLVLGVERMPFSGKLKFIEDLAIELGGASGSLGIEKSPVVFHSESNDGRSIDVIPAICYESIYGEYLTEFVREGANLIGVITNDGWWGDTPGYAQHLSYSRMRAIELRRDVARSANTGISAIINQRGDVLQQSQWWTTDALLGTVNLNSKLTFYAQHGDYIGRTASFFAVLLVLWSIARKLRGKVF
ncbi:MAG: apolipoprotein N-acyltransferase [Vicingaceae bacterium]